jgi:hypothetical protein
MSYNGFDVEDEGVEDEGGAQQEHDGLHPRAREEVAVHRLPITRT